MEQKIEIDNAKEAAGLFGEIDGNSALIESMLGVELHSLPDGIGVYGEDENVLKAEAVVRRLVDIQRGGEPITRQLVSYLAETARDGNVEQVAGYSPDCICVTSKGRPIKGKTRGQLEFVKAIAENDVTFAIGPAGTGKTFLAVAMAVNAFRNRQVSRIILTRPAVEAGEKLGFLPGDLQNKVDPYMRPLYDALQEMMGSETYLKHMEKGIIEVSPLAYMRGRTLDDAFIILDEAQNTSPEQMKMFLTRLGFRSRMVVTGDITQIDLPADRRSGLKEARRILHEVQGLRFVELTERDVVRNPLVQRIIRAYEHHDAHEHHAH